MKIEKVVIYSFGKHENLTIHFGPHMNVLYGLNEAGKTTIQQFILHVLFGFPPRNSALLRYEPKAGGKYGGRVHIQDHRYGKCTIERVHGKSAGDVIVFFEDGKQGGEEALQMLLQNYDRADFESIFSFSLLQLQGFEKMDEDQLSRTLLASGTMGVDSLHDVEKRMEKEMGELFKRSGRNPAINEKIKELRQLEIELKEEQEKVNTYAPTITRIHEIEQALSSLQEKEAVCRDQLQQYSLLRQLLPSYRKKESIERRLKQLKTINFPADGIRRLESIIGRLTEAEATVARMAAELSEVEAQLKKQDLSEPLMEIEQLLTKESEWHKWRAALSAETDELKRLESLKKSLIDRLGLKGEQAENILLKADVSLRKEEEMHEILNDMEKWSKEIEAVEVQKSQLEKELAEIEAQLQASEQPSAEEGKQAQEWPYIRDKLAEAKAVVALEKNEPDRDGRAVSIMLIMIGIGFIAFGLLQQQWLVVLAGLVVGGVSILMRPEKNTKRQSEIQEKKRFIAAYENKALEMEQLIAQIEDYRHESKRLEEALRLSRHRNRTVTEELNHLLVQESIAEASFESFMHQYSFDGLPSPSIVPELFRTMRRLQEVAREEMAVAEKKRQNEASLARRMVEIEEVVGQAVSLEGGYDLLRATYNNVKEEVDRQKTLRQKQEQLQSRLDEKKMIVKTYRNHLSALLAEANVETTEDYYDVYDAHEEKVRLREQAQQIEQQLINDQLPVEASRFTDEELEQRVQEKEKNASSIDEQMTALIHEKAALENKTEKLLTDDAYRNKLQLFAMKKAELATLAREWSARKALAEAINQTMLELKEKKLPEVLKCAEKIFGSLTEGAYESLVLSEKGTFLAVTVNGDRYPMIELSQATKEQAYIALRLALAQSLLESAPFPIIMDDPFVHFDERRLSRMIKILGNLTNHQFIYFTCHDKMKRQWTDATVINVSSLGSEQGAFT